MYTKPKNYYTEDGERVKIPEKYDGTAFLEPINDEPKPHIQEPSAHTEAIPQKRDVKISPVIEDNREEDEAAAETSAAAGFDGGFLSSLLRSNPFGKLGSIFSKKDGADLLSSFGTEELIIIGIALFLLFSRTGDKECALILAGLLFIR